MERNVGVNYFDESKPMFTIKTKEKEIQIEVILNDNMMYSVTLPIDTKVAEELKEALGEAIKEINPT